ncbi:hypothetical protein D3C87_1245620 [compost metagenome]
MRKKKHYFGQRRIKHTWGINMNAPKFWVVPRMLRQSFYNDYQAFMERVGMDPVVQMIRSFPAERSSAPAQVGTICYDDSELNK